MSASVVGVPVLPQSSYIMRFRSSVALSFALKLPVVANGTAENGVAVIAAAAVADGCCVVGGRRHLKRSAAP